MSGIAASVSRCCHRRAVTMPMVAIMLPVLLGFAALAVDVGHLYCVRAELQNAVDSAALAGASGLSNDPVEVRSRAISFAALNIADGQPVRLTDTNVELGSWDQQTGAFGLLTGVDENRASAVRVSAGLSAANGSAVDLFFAKTLGILSGDVGAAATATFGTGDTWDVIIVQDVTGSFKDALDLAKVADAELVSCLKDHTDNESRVGMVKHTGSSQVVHPLEAINTGYDALIAKINALQPCCSSSCGSELQCSGTNIAAGINGAVAEFAAAPLPDPERGRAIVLVSDGQPKASGGSATDAELRDLAIQAADNAYAQGISMYCVYYAGSSGSPAADAAFLAGLVRGEGTFEQTPVAEDLSSLVWRICASLPLMLVQ